MKKQIFYVLMAIIASVGFNSCGTQTRTTGPTTGTTGTTVGTTGDRTATTTGTRTGTVETRGTTTTGTTGTQTRTQMGTQQDQFQLEERTDYSFNNQNYSFSPDRDGNITITRSQGGQQTPYGTMRRAGDSGYYILNTSSDTGEEQVLFGRFDEQGNFRTHRYDRNNDRVEEGQFRTSRPATGTRTGTGNNQRN